MPGTRNADLMPKRFCIAHWLALLLIVVFWGRSSPTIAQAQQSPAPEQEQPDASGQQPLTLTEQVIRDVLGPLQRGIEEHNVAQVLSVFDPQETPDYAQFRDQMRAFFSQNDAVRFRYKVLQVTSEKDRGFVIAEIDMAATPSDETKLTVQRSTQMRFEIALRAKGWKLTGFKPSDFFAQ
jgi:hypothetical protein